MDNSNGYKNRRNQLITRNQLAAPDGKRIVALMPGTEAKGARAVQNQVVSLENFFDELRRLVPVGKYRHTPLMAELLVSN